MWIIQMTSTRSSISIFTLRVSFPLHFINRWWLMNNDFKTELFSIHLFSLKSISNAHSFRPILTSLLPIAHWNAVILQAAFATINNCLSEMCTWSILLFHTLCVSAMLIYIDHFLTIIKNIDTIFIAFVLHIKVAWIEIVHS